jgi:hypothetical protein
MVRTSKGPAEKSVKTPGADAGTTQTDGDDRTIRNNADLDDATWGQVEAMARSQNSSPADVIRRALTNQYGEPQPTGGYHSGMDNDPANE